MSILKGSRENETTKMRVSFHGPYLDYRGTEFVLMDYMQENREILGHGLFFLTPWGEEVENHPATSVVAP